MVNLRQVRVAGQSGVEYEVTGLHKLAVRVRGFFGEIGMCLKNVESDLWVRGGESASDCISELGNGSLLKMQYLLYYAQAWHLVWEGVPLFPEPIYRGDYGPLVSEISYTGSKEKVEGLGSVSASARINLRAVKKAYGHRNTQWLGDLLRTEKPWLDCKVGEELSLDAMKAYYGGLGEESTLL